MLANKTIVFTVASFLASAALAEPTQCPKWEAGARYPWQSDEIMRGDQFAWLVLDVDRDGVVFNCRIGDNNYIENETRFWLCKNYSERWRSQGGGIRSGQTDVQAIFADRRLRPRPRRQEGAQAMVHGPSSGTARMLSRTDQAG